MENNLFTHHSNRVAESNKHHDAALLIVMQELRSELESTLKAFMEEVGRTIVRAREKAEAAFAENCADIALSGENMVEEMAKRHAEAVHVLATGESLGSGR